MLRKEAMSRAQDRKPKRSQSTPSLALSADDRALFDALKAARLDLARQSSVPAFVILPDRSLLDMVHLKPERRDQMMMVHGVGQAKLDKYGDVFLGVIRGHVKHAA